MPSLTQRGLRRQQWKKTRDMLPRDQPQNESTKIEKSQRVDSEIEVKQRRGGRNLRQQANPPPETLDGLGTCKVPLPVPLPAAGTSTSQLIQRASTPKK